MIKGSVRHPDRIADAGAAVTAVVQLHASGNIPSVISKFMIATPTRRLLRAIYGSDLNAALALLGLALAALPRKCYWAVQDFWCYRILMQSPDREMQEMLDKLDLEDAEDGE